MMKLYCATTNAGKLREFRLAVERLAAGRLELATLPNLEDLPPPAETGTTFEENAIQKTLYYGAHSGGLLFAEDSGLAVDALDGAPGVYSARYAGEAATDEDNNRLLLERMRGVANRSARFVCVAALASEGRIVKTFRGTVEGQIADSPRGHNGFGYDPLFYHPPFGCTLAEVDPARKLTVSHRGRAIEQMLGFLRNQLTAGR